MLKVVFDTNVTISAFLWEGNPAKVYDLVTKGEIILFSSVNIELEFIKVLAYKKFKLTREEINIHVNNLRKFARYIEVESEIDLIKDDPTDNIFIECAVDGKADYIISGDHHLLNLGNYKGIQIVKVKDFLVKEKFI